MLHPFVIFLRRRPYQSCGRGRGLWDSGVLSVVWDGAQNPRRHYPRSFLPAFKFIHIECSDISSWKLWILICSLPTLEDVSIGCVGISDSDDHGVIFRPSTLPPLTETLTLSPEEGVEPIVRPLLDLQLCARFRRLELKVGCWLEQDARWASALTEACFHTLEYLRIKDSIIAESGPPNFHYVIPLPDL